MPAVRPCFRLRAVPWTIACLAAAAQAAPEPPAPARVEIIGTAAAAEADTGRDATAARTIVPRETIARDPGGSLLDVLRRVPGITVGGGPGRAGDLRLRGLGGGYTQVLVNGEPVPAGFELDSLPTAQVERIEIARIATVDQGAQAIAGTINIVLRQPGRKPVRELKAGAGVQAGRVSLSLDGLVADRFDDRSVSLGAGLSRRDEAWPVRISQQRTDAAGQPVLQRLTDRQAVGLSEGLSLTPRLSWQPTPADRLGLEALVRHTRFDDHNDDRREALLGAAPPYAFEHQRLRLRTTLAQPRLQWNRTMDGGATLESRLGANWLRRASDSRFSGDDPLQSPLLLQRMQAATQERGITAAGKLRLPYSDGHAVALGWDGEHTRRDDSRSQRQSSPAGLPVTDLDERYRVTVQRVAVYLQDEWDLDASLSIYAGVRWSTLRTRTTGDGIEPAGHRASVTSPVLQALWKPAALAGDQLRLALSRSHKAPRAADLSPRRFVAFDNTATTPDLQGNPGLRPELAWGLDLAYEHVLPARAGTVNLTLGSRRIDDVILDSLRLDGGLWVARKTNQGRARVDSLELDGRWRLRATWPAAPDAELRAGLARNWSAVQRVPGPDNRLDSQVPWSATLGLDWRLQDLPLSWTASLTAKGGVRARTALNQASTAGALRTLDLGAAWKLSPTLQLRASLANLLRPRVLATDTVFDSGGDWQQTTDAPGRVTVRLAVEARL